MKKFRLFFVLIILASCSLQAQLYISPNSYMYVSDNYLFVKQDINLQTSANLFLRNESQLLQGTSSTSGNKGAGATSIFQEGTVNNYAYNYWCSPVGNASVSTGNEAFGITMLNRPTGLITDSTPNIVGSVDGTTTNTSLSISSRWIYKFLSSSTYSQWINVGSASSINAGEGFTMKGTSGTDNTTIIGVQNNPGSAQRYDFRGKPNDGIIDVTVASGMLTLTGNPYPSAIDLNLFLTDPSNASKIDGTALFWEQDTSVNSHLIAAYRGGYGVYNGTTSVYAPAVYYTYDSAGGSGPVYSSPLHNFERRFCPVGQGFMVTGTASGTVQFKNSFRVVKKEGAGNNSQFNRPGINHVSVNDFGFFGAIPNVAGTDYTKISKAPTPHIKINGSLNNQAVRQIALCFLPNALDGIDNADSKSPDVDSNLPFDMYLYLGNTEYVHSTTAFDINKRYPLGFKNNAIASFRIQVAGFVNFNGTSEVYLFDKETGLYHDIKNVEYEVTLPAGVSNTRFEITFKNGTLSTANSELIKSVAVFQNNGTSQLTIKNTELLDLKSCDVYDISGKLIFSKQGLGSDNEYVFSTASFSDGVYVVKLATIDNLEIVKKVIISKK